MPDAYPQPDTQDADPPPTVLAPAPAPAVPAGGTALPGASDHPAQPTRSPLALGPATEEVERLLVRAQRLGERERLGLAARCKDMLGRHGSAGGALEGESRFHAFITAGRSGLHDEFQALWQGLMPEPEDESAAMFMVLDAALATMLRPLCDQGEFTTADHDCLLAAWRACVEGCPRSRLFLHLISSGRPVEALWRVVDGVLAPAQ